MKGKNIGDWSEIYVFYKIMEDGKIHTADNNMQIIKDAYLPVLKILREEETGKINEYYTNNEENSERRMKLYFGNEEILDLKLDEFRKNSEILLNHIIKAKKESSNSLSYPDIEKHLSKIKITKIKSPSVEINNSFGGKADITMQIIQQDSLRINAGFSIKSSLGSPATLINSSASTNFIYELKGCTEEIKNHVNQINTRNKIIDRIKYLENNNICYKFDNISSSIFLDNLFLISSDLADIIGHGLWQSYALSDGTRLGSKKKMTDILSWLVLKNPMNIKSQNNDSNYLHNYYSKRLKDLLFSSACGMVPNTPFSGNLKIKGGYIFVTEKANVVAFYASDEDNFKEFLLENTKFDTPSSNRQEPASVWAENVNGETKYFLSLNLQVKFLK